MVYLQHEKSGEQRNESLIKNEDGYFKNTLELKHGWWFITAEALSCEGAMSPDFCEKVFTTTHVHEALVETGRVNFVTLEMYQVFTGDLNVNVYTWLNAGMFSSIQDAINVAIANGQGVYVPPGDYYENIVMREGVPVVGSGFGHTKLYAGKGNDIPIITFPTKQSEWSTMFLGSLSIIQEGPGSAVVMNGSSAFMSNLLIIFADQGIVSEESDFSVFQSTFVDINEDWGHGIEIHGGEFTGAKQNVFYNMTNAVLFQIPPKNFSVSENNYWQVGYWGPYADVAYSADPKFDENFVIHQQFLIDRWIGAFVYGFDPYCWCWWTGR
jgi:hypothetical protein